jgi:hypothetical protein
MVIHIAVSVIYTASLLYITKVPFYLKFAFALLAFSLFTLNGIAIRPYRTLLVISTAAISYIVIYAVAKLFTTRKT